MQPVAAGDHLVGGVEIDPVVEKLEFGPDGVEVTVDGIVGRVGIHERASLYHAASGW